MIEQVCADAGIGEISCEEGCVVGLIDGTSDIESSVISTNGGDSIAAVDSKCYVTRGRCFIPLADRRWTCLNDSRTVPAR